MNDVTGDESSFDNAPGSVGGMVSRLYRVRSFALSPFDDCMTSCFICTQVIHGDEAFVQHHINSCKLANSTL